MFNITHGNVDAKDDDKFRKYYRSSRQHSLELTLFPDACMERFLLNLVTGKWSPVAENSWTYAVADCSWFNC